MKFNLLMFRFARSGNCVSMYIANWINRARTRLKKLMFFMGKEESQEYVSLCEFFSWEGRLFALQWRKWENRIKSRLKVMYTA